MSSKHTPGPWFGDGREKVTGDILVYAPEAAHGCRDICFVPEDDEQDKANARLIAAAPDLYEALEGAVKLLRLLESLHDDIIIQSDVDAYAAALTKVTLGEGL